MPIGRASMRGTIERSFLITGRLVGSALKVNPNSISVQCALPEERFEHDLRRAEIQSPLQVTSCQANEPLENSAWEDTTHRKIGVSSGEPEKGSYAATERSDEGDYRQSAESLVLRGGI